MEDKEKALDELRKTEEACAAALTTLDENHSSSSSGSPPPLAVIYKDFLSLSTLIYASTTRLAISLKPSSPTWTASVTPLQELARNALALTTCACLYSEDAHGCTLRKEALATARQLIAAVQDLVQTLSRTFVSSAAEDSSDYLVKVGTVHTLVDRARGPDGLPKDNLAAVRRRWAEDKSVMDDALKEVGEMIEEAEAEGDTGEDDFLDDGWDELGLGSKKMDQEELKRAKLVYPLLRLINLLHKRVLLDVIGGTLAFPNSTADKLLEQSSSDLAAYDDLIATLYAPQKTSSILPAAKTLVAHVQALSRTILEIIPSPSLESQMDSLQIESSSKGSKADGKPKDVRKWFETCFTQLEKMTSSIDKEIS